MTDDTTSTEGTAGSHPGVNEPMGKDPAPVPTGSEPEPEARKSNVAESDYKTQGRTLVTTRKGWRFAPTDKSLPVIHSGGVLVNQDQATSLVKESGGLVSVVNKEGEPTDAR